MSSTNDMRPSIAVLPFNNMSGDPEQEYFSDGITEDIITDLSKISGLFVVARHTAFTYKGKPVKVERVGQELGVAYVLEGSVRKAGSRVRVTGQLIDSKEGGHVWAERFDRDLTDIFAIQDEITHAIVEQLKVRLLPREKRSIAQAPTDNVEAYTYFLRGREFLHQHSQRYFDLARRMFAKAIELDRNYARAYAGIAVCDAWLFMVYQVEVSLEGILEMAARALALDPDLPEAHTARGVALSAARKPDEANVEFELALTLDPNSFDAHFLYARPAFMQGRTARAVELLERCAELHPNDYKPHGLLIAMYRSLGRDADCKQSCREMVRLAEAEATAHPEDPRPVCAAALAFLERDFLLADRTAAKHQICVGASDQRLLARDPLGFTARGRANENVHARFPRLEKRKRLAIRRQIDWANGSRRAPGSGGRSRSSQTTWSRATTSRAPTAGWETRRLPAICSSRSFAKAGVFGKAGSRKTPILRVCVRIRATHNWLLSCTNGP